MRPEPKTFSHARAVVIIMAATVVPARAELPPEVLSYADTVLFNGEILTADADEDFTVAEAMAIRDGRFLAIGDSEHILSMAGPETERIDLQGRSVTPGFIYSDGDNAVPGGDLVKESQWGGTIRQQLGGETLDQVTATIKYIVANEVLPDEIVYIKITDQWAGPIMETWDRSTVDELSPDNPTLILPDCCHAIANSRLIDLMLAEGFPADHLHLIRDSNGVPTGQLGSLAVGFVGRELRPTPPPEWIRQHGVEAAGKQLNAYAMEGITTATGHMTGLTVLILRTLYADDGLPIRVFPALDLVRQNAFPERTLKRVGNLMDFALVDGRGPMVQIVGTSVGPHSGAPDSAIGLLTIEPKTRIVPELGRNPHGYDRWSAEFYTGKSTQELTPAERMDTEYYNLMLARRYGYNVNGVHDMGSGGIMLAMQAVLDAEQQDQLYVAQLSRAQALDHNIDWIADNFAFFKAHEDFFRSHLRVGISLASALRQRDADVFGLEDVLSLQYGMEGLERIAPLRSLLDAGIPFHIEGTDPGNLPLEIVKKAVLRLDVKGRQIAPDEALTREQALLAITRWAARFMSAEDELGSIEAGKWADLVVFDGDVMETPIERVDDLRPVLTMVGGRIVYRRTP